MNGQIPPPPSRSLRLVQVVLYTFAGIVLAVGLIAGISLVAGAQRSVGYLLLPLALMGNDAILSIVTPLLTSLLVNLGVVLLVLALVNSLVLYAAGRLIGHIFKLEGRIAQLETGG